MTERSYFWGGTPFGDAAFGNTDMEFTHILRKFSIYNSARQGVIPRYANELEVSNPAGNTVRIASGAAVVDGILYNNSANLDLTIAGGAGLYLIVLRKSVQTQEVRGAIRAGIEGGKLSPIQHEDVLFEIVLARAQLNKLGQLIALIDQRDYAMISSAPSLISREGGNVTDWNVSGTTVYEVYSSREQVGVIEIPDISGGTDPQQEVTKDITFPVPFKTIPVVFVSLQWAYDLTSLGSTFVGVDNITTTGFTIHAIKMAAPNIFFIRVAWWAIGE
jgi:hypothetical protein